MNFSTFLLRSLKAERSDFLGENGSGTGALSEQGLLNSKSFKIAQETRLPADILWSSFVTHSFLPHGMNA